MILDNMEVLVGRKKMRDDNEKKIGILGGMGPEATLDFYQKIIKNTKAERDQDHLKVIIFNNPKIPDRTDYILGKGESPLPALIESAQQLERWGADFLTIPCNTAHYFFNTIQKHISIPILNMIELTADKIIAEDRGRKVGLLATEGTVKSGIYSSIFNQKSLEILIPEQPEQDVVSERIYQVKKGRTEGSNNDLVKVCHSLTNCGADVLVLGCTELPILFSKIDHSFSILDPTEILAKEAVRQAY